MNMVCQNKFWNFCSNRFLNPMTNLFFYFQGIQYSINGTRCTKTTLPPFQENCIPGDWHSPPPFSLSYVNFSLILCANFPYNTQMAPRRLISLLGLGVRPWPWRLTPWRWGTLQWTPKWQKTGVSPFPRALWDVLPEVKLSLQVKKIENFILHNHKYTPCLFCFRIHPHGYQL